MTIDQGPEMSRYQGLVPLEGGGLEQAAHEYFSRSEQIPTRVRLAVAEEFRAGENGAAGVGAPAAFCCNSCRIRPSAPVRPISIPGDAPPGTAPHAYPRTTPGLRAGRWSRPSTIIELIDPDLSSERLAYRLFHERGVRVFRAAAVNAQCSCSRDKVENMLRSFSQEDRDDMVEDGRITVTCEFCSSTYVFAPDDIATQEAATG